MRLTAQNILLSNLRVAVQRRRRWWHFMPPPAVPAWPGIRLDLNGAFLLEFSLLGCQLDYADFTRVQFSGRAYFVGAEFTRVAKFRDAQFSGGVSFEDAQLPGRADFRDAQFTGEANFKDVLFPAGASFRGAQFTGGVSFEGARVCWFAESGSVWPPGWTTRPAKPYNGEGPGFLYLAEVEDGHLLDVKPARGPNELRPYPG